MNNLYCANWSPCMICPPATLGQVADKFLNDWGIVPEKTMEGSESTARKWIHYYFVSVGMLASCYYMRGFTHETSTGLYNVNYCSFPISINSDTISSHVEGEAETLYQNVVEHYPGGAFEGYMPNGIITVYSNLYAGNRDSSDVTNGLSMHFENVYNNYTVDTVYYLESLTGLTKNHRMLGMMWLRTSTNKVTSQDRTNTLTLPVPDPEDYKWDLGL